MSGGSYNYLCYKDYSEIIDQESYLNEMADRLAGLGYADDAARATHEILLEIKKYRVRMDTRLADIGTVWKAVEWWDSCDTTEDGVKEALEKYRNKK